MVEKTMGCDSLSMNSSRSGGGGGDSLWVDLVERVGES